MVAPFAPITAPRSFPTCIKTSHSFVISAESFSPPSPAASRRVRSISAAPHARREPVRQVFLRDHPGELAVGDGRHHLRRHRARGRVGARGRPRAERLRPRRTRTACRGLARSAARFSLLSLPPIKPTTNGDLWQSSPRRNRASVSILSSLLRRGRRTLRRRRRRYDGGFRFGVARIRDGLVRTPSSPFRDSDGAISCLDLAPAEPVKRAEVLVGSSSV